MNSNSALLFAALCAALCAFRAPAQQPATSPDTAAAAPLPRAEDVADLDDLVGFIQARERVAKTVTMQLRTRGQFPDGNAFTTEGEIRVLGQTHFLSRTTARFGSDIEVRTESVRSPDGMQMREVDPVQGEVFVQMDAATLARIDSASRALSGSATGGAFQAPEGRAQSPLGSALLTDLRSRYELQLEGPLPIDGQRCWVVKGPLKGDESEVELLGLGADHVDVVVREADGALLRMTQLRAGQPLLDVQILSLRLDAPLEPDDFRLSVPTDEFLDVFDHPPAAAQIERLFEEARAAGWEDPGPDAASDRRR